jgi:hypothetical protein
VSQIKYQGKGSYSIQKAIHQKAIHQKAINSSNSSSRE